MKKICYFLVVAILCSSCREQIALDLNTSPPQLVIDATGEFQFKEDTIDNTDYDLVFSVALSLTATYYENISDLSIVNTAKVSIEETRLDGSINIYNLLYDSQRKIYTDIIKKNKGLSSTYILKVEYKEQVYVSTPQQLIRTPVITSIELETSDSLDDELRLESRVYFKDDPNTANFYLLRLENPLLSYEQPNELHLSEDRLFEGTDYIFKAFTRISGELYFENIEYTLIAITQTYYKYMIRILQQTGSGGGPNADAPASPIRGNIVNQTNKGNYPFGYFFISEKQKYSYQKD